MATRRDRTDYVLTDVLQALQTLQNQRGYSGQVTSKAIHAWLRAHEDPYWGLRPDRDWPEEPLVLIENFLLDLKKIGLVAADVVDIEKRPFNEIRWRLDPGWVDGRRGEEPPREPPRDPPRPGGNDGDDGDGLGGIGEVLAHPYLFAVSADDFGAAIDRALGGAR